MMHGSQHTCRAAHTPPQKHNFRTHNILTDDEEDSKSMTLSAYGRSGRLTPAKKTPQGTDDDGYESSGTHTSMFHVSVCSAQRRACLSWMPGMTKNARTLSMEVGTNT